MTSLVTGIREFGFRVRVGCAFSSAVDRRHQTGISKIKLSLCIYRR